jgi:hypothetical protein
MGNRFAGAAPHGMFPAAGDDQWIAIAARDDAEFQALCDVMEHPDLVRDPRFATLPSRLRHQDELEGLVTAWTRGQDKHEAAERLQSAGAGRPIASGWHSSRSGDQVRSLLKEIGLLFPRAIDGQFRNHVRRLLDEHVLRSVVDGLLAVHEQVEQQQTALDKRVREEAKTDETTRRLMSVPGVGLITALLSATRPTTQCASG